MPWNEVSSLERQNPPRVWLSVSALQKTSLSQTASPALKPWSLWSEHRQQTMVRWCLTQGKKHLLTENLGGALTPASPWGYTPPIPEVESTARNCYRKLELNPGQQTKPHCSLELNMPDYCINASVVNLNPLLNKPEQWSFNTQKSRTFLQVTDVFHFQFSFIIHRVSNSNNACQSRCEISFVISSNSVFVTVIFRIYDKSTFRSLSSLSVRHKSLARGSVKVHDRNS